MSNNDDDNDEFNVSFDAQIMKILKILFKIGKKTGPQVILLYEREDARVFLVHEPGLIRSKTYLIMLNHLKNSDFSPLLRARVLTV